MVRGASLEERRATNRGCNIKDGQRNAEKELEDNNKQT